MERVIRLGALNVVTQPHSTSGYVNLIRRVYERRQAARVRGDRFGMISTLAASGGASIGRRSSVNGWITCFTMIDQSGEWVDVSTGQLADAQTVAQIQIPGNLHPNPSSHLYRFYPSEHLLVFEIGNSGNRLTPSVATKLFDRLFSADSVVEDFGEVVVTPMPSKDTVQEIITSSSVRELFLVVHAPNPPVGRDAERATMRRLEARRLKREETRMVAKPDEAVEFDSELQESTRIAAKNGHAEARITRGGRVERISTLDTPYVYTHTYYDDVTTLEEAFRSAADTVKSQLTER